MWSQLQNYHDPIIGALEMDAACVVVNLFMLPDEPELFRQCVENISRVRADCHRYGMPLMIEPLVMLPNDVRGGYQWMAMLKDRHAGASCLGNGSRYHQGRSHQQSAGFSQGHRGSAVPGSGAGRGREDLRNVLAKSAALVAEGANGMVYGRNIYQHDNPRPSLRPDGYHPSGCGQRRSMGHL